MENINEDNEQTYLRLFRFLMDDFLEHELSLDEMIVLIWLQWKANPVNGVIHVNYAGLAVDFQGRYSKNHINKIVLSLKRKRYIWFKGQSGRKGSFIIEIDYYPLSNGSFKDISNRFGQSGGRTRATLRGSSQSEDLAEIDSSRQRSKLDKHTLASSIFGDIARDTRRGANNENEKENKNDNSDFFSSPVDETFNEIPF